MLIVLLSCRCNEHEDSYLLCNSNVNLLNLKSPACLNFHVQDFSNMPNITYVTEEANNHVLAVLQAHIIKFVFMYKKNHCLTP